jgi:ABC-type transporter Mla MlaB component
MVLELPTALTIPHAAELKAALLSALEPLERGQSLELDARMVNEVDVTGLQLLCAVRLSAVARQLRLRFVPKGRSEPLLQAISAAGLGRGDRERWLLEEANDG